MMNDPIEIYYQYLNKLITVLKVRTLQLSIIPWTGMSVINRIPTPVNTTVCMPQLVSI